MAHLKKRRDRLTVREKKKCLKYEKNVSSKVSSSLVGKQGCLPLKSFRIAFQKIG